MRKKLTLKFDGMKEMLTKEQMKAIKGGKLGKEEDVQSVTYSWCCCFHNLPPTPENCGSCDKKGDGYSCNGEGVAYGCEKG